MSSYGHGKAGAPGGNDAFESDAGRGRAPGNAGRCHPGALRCPGAGLRKFDANSSRPSWRPCLVTTAMEHAHHSPQGRRRKGASMKILVATDGSRGGAAALKFAARLALRDQASEL